MNNIIIFINIHTVNGETVPLFTIRNAFTGQKLCFAVKYTFVLTTMGLKSFVFLICVINSFPYTL